MLSSLVLGLGFALSFVASARAAEKPVCSAVLYEDAELLKTLSPRLRPIVESARFRTLIANGDAAWKPFHEALDWGFAHPGKRATASFGKARVSFHFRAPPPPISGTALVSRLLDPSGAKALELVIDDLKLGAPVDAFAFLDFMAAELGWIAKARVSGKLERGLKITGRDLENRRFADLLASIGFRKSKWPGPQCYLFGVAGGVLGAAGGRVFFARFDANDENGSIYEEQRKFYRDLAFGAAGGAGVAVASACFNKTGRNYSIDFDPEGIPRKSETVPEEPTLPSKDDPIPTGT